MTLTPKYLYCHFQRLDLRIDETRRYEVEDVHPWGFTVRPGAYTVGTARGWAKPAEPIEPNADEDHWEIGVLEVRDHLMTESGHRFALKPQQNWPFGWMV